MKTEHDGPVAGGAAGLRSPQRLGAMVVSVCAALLLAGSAVASEAQQAFEAGDYRRAAELQEAAMKTRPASPEGYHNLGQALERAGEPVAAALNYARALRLDPGFTPARTAIKELAAGRSPSPLPRSWRDDLRTVVHPEVLLVSGVVLFWAGLFGALLLRGPARGVAVAAVVLGIGGGLLGFLADARLNGRMPAIVSAKQGAELLTAPASNSTLVVSLSPGSPVEVISPRGAWSFVDVGDGAKGWVQTDRLQPIVPGETL